MRRPAPLRQVAADVWPLLQQTAAATAAWVIAKLLGDHQDPFFAPIAAVIALNAARGERGVNAIRLLAGVLVGIVAGELAVTALGGGYGSLTVAVFTALVAASVLGGSRIVLAQAAAGAILTVAVPYGDAGPNRIVDALIGAGVALVFSQLLFTPEPVALLRRSETKALESMAAGLELAARALREDDDRLGEQAMASLRDLRDRLADLAQMRKVSARVIRYSVAWRFRSAQSERERESAGHLDLLGGSCLMLARMALAAAARERELLAPAVRGVAAALHDLARDPGDHAARRRATERVLHLLTEFNGSDLESEASGRDAASALRIAAADVLVFAGVPAGHAVAAVREGAGHLEVPAPPDLSWPHLFFRRHRRRRERHEPD
ncbi:aromatic acid exporter family protein [Actinomadura sp. 9N407]|uniref:aromatic acid exporter family protein n=1 Tax=Actinomadura sp. 9N407 TaxID=3375154 RepID=UPI00379F95C1